MRQTHPGTTRPALRNRLAALALATLLASATQAQTAVLAPPQNVLVLSAEASAEVAQDMLQITLQLVREGSDAAVVQSQLRQALDAALADARKAQRPGQLDFRSGQFSVFPRYQQGPGKPSISGWQGQAELVLEGRDVAAISQLAGRLTGMNVVRVAFSLSKEARERATAEVSAEAIGRFGARASAMARQFGFAGYSLREVTVGGGEGPGMVVQQSLRSMATSSAAPEVQPVAPGKSTVSVTVSGSVQMSPR